MNQSEIKEKLQGVCDRINYIIETFDKKPSYYRESVAAEYTQLKKDLRAERHRINTVRWRRQASPAEIDSYLPAILNACVELRVRSGSPPCQEMMGNLFAARLEISFLLEQLKN